MQSNIRNEETKSEVNHHDRVTVYALLMALGTFSSRVLALFRDQLFAACFPSMVRDAWTAAFRLPNLFRRILGEGSMSVSFIPVFVESIQDNNSKDRAKNLLNSFYTILLIVLATLTAFGTLWPEAFLSWMLDPKYIAIPGKYELTLRMARIMFVFIFFMSTYAYFMGILNALGRYGLPAMAPTLFNVAMIISNFVPNSWLHSPGDGISWGVVVGGILQMGILIPSLVKLGYFPRLHLNFRNPDVNRVLRNMLPGILGLGLLQITTIVNLRFASSLGEGPITYIYLADRLLELPLSLVSVSLGTALLPTLSSLWAQGEKVKMMTTGNYFLRLNLYMAVPAAIGLFVLARPLIEVLFQRGEFTEPDVISTALVVRIYAFILFTSSCVRVIVPSFYAIKNTWLPALASLVSLILHVILAPILMDKFGLAGLVSSSFVTGLLNLFILFAAYGTLIGHFDHLRVFKSLSLFSVSGLGLWMVLQVYSPMQQGIFAQTNMLFVSRLVALGFVIVLGVLTYFGISHFLRIKEYQESIQSVLGRVKRKFI